jgi:hypothetical protein
MSGFDFESLTLEEVETIENLVGESIDEAFGKEMQIRGLWTKQILKSLSQTRGNIQFIKGIPQDLKDKYKEGVYRMSKRPLRSDESVYLQYENILTDNHRIITDKNYLNYRINKNSILNVESLV